MKNFEIKNILSFQTDKHAGEKIIIRNDFSEAEIYLLGGQLTHFQPIGAEKVIYDGKESYIIPPKSVHFGIPICWPWFGPHPSDTAKAQHGFARNSLWKIKKTEVLKDASTLVILSLKENPETLLLFPHTFTLELTFIIGKTLQIELKTINTSPTIMHLTQALHSYFFISHIENIIVKGLEGTSFIDQLDDNRLKIEQDPLQFNQTLDRIYLNTDRSCEIIDSKLNRRIIIKKSHSMSTVVWNPWEGNNLHDVADEKYSKFVCIETANTQEDKITLKINESYTLIQNISLENL